MLVARRAPSVSAGVGAERAALHDRCLAARDRVLVKERRGMIPMYRGKIPKAELVGAVIGIPRAAFLHDATSTTCPARRTHSPKYIAEVRCQRTDVRGRLTRPEHGRCRSDVRSLTSAIRSLTMLRRSSGSPMSCPRKRV